MKPMVFDLYSKQGGAGMGYHLAGFDVVGSDIKPQPRYPFEFIQMDALEALRLLAEPNIPDWLFNIVAVHTSPPCQAHSNAQKIRGNEHEDLIGDTRELLQEIGLPWIIENVPGAPLNDPVELCGCMFPELGTYRPRLFETSFPLAQPEHQPHTVRTTKMGRKPVEGEFMHVVGNFSGVEKAKRAMGIDWMSRDGLREAIPPAYARYVGEQLMAFLNADKREEAA